MLSSIPKHGTPKHFLSFQSYTNAAAECSGCSENAQMLNFHAENSMKMHEGEMGNVVLIIEQVQSLSRARHFCAAH